MNYLQNYLRKNNTIRTTTFSTRREVAQLSQRDRATRCVGWNLVNYCCTTVQKIAHEKVCNGWMTLKITQGHRKCMILLVVYRNRFSILHRFRAITVLFTVHVTATWPPEILQFACDSLNCRPHTPPARLACIHYSQHMLYIFPEVSWVIEVSFVTNS